MTTAGNLVPANEEDDEDEGVVVASDSISFDFIIEALMDLGKTRYPDVLP
jgi:hypothetical protein